MSYCKKRSGFTISSGSAHSKLTGVVVWKWLCCVTSSCSSDKVAMFFVVVDMNLLVTVTLG